MADPEQSAPTTRGRREPPRFRPVVVRRLSRLSPRMVRVTFTGPELEDLTLDEPAASVRLLLPSPGTGQSAHQNHVDVRQFKHGVAGAGTVGSRRSRCTIAAL